MWFEFHDIDGRTIFVNMAHATDFRRWNPDDKHTQISMGSQGDKARIILVTETPDEIAKLVQTEQRKLASQQ
ncbi:hypothetical protein HFN97_26125 [Rhizobium laguerreae]|uniref:hypothetical protein n=1 Tax=Rhizobium laguerreae TaxID=1076926 RepID=UPI001C9047BB|nr:hypothetical protein [Rhizobium laguerreae]MBY3361253.1 hypothetical protein [Rhizobium laguerreae]